MDMAGKEISSNQNDRDIFERLRNSKTIPSNDPQANKMMEAYATKKLLVQTNYSSTPK
jgi:predicted CoA-binding protein